MNTDQPTKQTATDRYPEQPHTASTRAGCYNTLAEQAQKAVGRAAHRTNLLALVLFLLLLGVGAVLLFALPEHTFSEKENRDLQTLPSLSSLQNITDGSYAASFAHFCQDQFPLREQLIAVHAAAELALGKGESNDVLCAADGYLFPEPSTRYDNLAKNLAGISAFSQASQIDVTLAVAPRSIDVMTAKLPALFDDTAARTAWTQLQQTLAQSSVDSCDLLTPLKMAAAADEQVFYRTDHHWTTLGAYYAYAALLQHMDMQPYALHDFSRETASDAFYGTTWSAAGMWWVKPDRLEYFRYPQDAQFRTEIAYTNLSFAGFYDRSFLEKKDQYASFLGGNYALTTITAPQNAQPRPRLLLIKDSYAHALAPFLARHFDLVLLDLRYYKLSLSDCLSQYPVDRILILENMDSLLTASTLSRLGSEYPS